MTIAVNFRIYSKPHSKSLPPIFFQSCSSYTAFAVIAESKVMNPPLLTHLPNLAEAWDHQSPVLFTNSFPIMRVFVSTPAPHQFVNRSWLPVTVESSPSISVSLPLFTGQSLKLSRKGKWHPSIVDPYLPPTTNSSDFIPIRCQWSSVRLNIPPKSWTY